MLVENFKKKVALIGGAGFIGHNLAIALKSRGHSVLVIDNLAVNNILSFTNQNIKNRNIYWSMLNKRLDLLHQKQIQVNIEDARNYNLMSMILDNFMPDTIVQLAAVSHADKSNKDPHTTFDHSLRTLENTLDIAKNYNSHVIYFSSSMVYGNFEKDVVDEESQCNPIGIYGTLKYSGELILKAYNNVFGVPYTIVRPSALYGERCVSRRVGQVFIENAVQGNKIIVNGTGTEKLDFTYIDDLIEGVILILEDEKAKMETFNLTYGRSHSINHMLDILKKCFDKIEINYVKRDKFTPNRGTLSVDKAREILGYVPKYNLDLGYLKYIDWYKKFWKNLEKDL
ncbi:MAG: nucleoside-diphosphate sugar epimerase [Candidatus Marinimicrobia bacterium]|nr:nucleoside-diphosphate sugar epimerase [Candidatus Neomarinimicrobiota bacterium]